MKRALLSIFLFAVITATADQIIKIRVEQSNAVRPARVLLDTSGSFKVDTTAFTETSGRTVLIYQSSRQRLWHVDYAGRTYVELYADVARSAGRTLDRARELINEQSDKWGWGLDMDAAESWQVVPLQQELSIGGHTAQGQAVKKGQDQLVVWTVPWSVSGVTRDSMQSLYDMVTLSDQLSRGAASSWLRLPVPAEPFTYLAQLEGYPVLCEYHRDGVPVLRVHIALPESSTFDSSDWTVPESFKRTLM